jgi:hypothetical protein
MEQRFDFVETKVLYCSFVDKSVIWTRQNYILQEIILVLDN